MQTDISPWRSFWRSPGDANGRQRTIWASEMRRAAGDALMSEILRGVAHRHRAGDWQTNNIAVQSKSKMRVRLAAAHARTDGGGVGLRQSGQKRRRSCSSITSLVLSAGSSSTLPQPGCPWFPILIPQPHGHCIAMAARESNLIISAPQQHSILQKHPADMGTPTMLVAAFNAQSPPPLHLPACTCSDHRTPTRAPS